MLFSFGKIISLIIVFLLLVSFNVSLKHVEPKTSNVYRAQKQGVVISDKTNTATDYNTVDYIIDGDTIKLLSGETVRYIGINTPEMKDDRNIVQCFAKEAKARNKDLVNGKVIHLEKDISDIDKYNRLLRYVYLVATGTEQVFINLKLVQEGYAYASSYPPDIKYQDLFRHAQNQARLAKRGLWSKCQK